MEKKKKIKSYKGKFRPERPEKYKGNFRNIIYRSMWERRFMVYCDRNENILQWGSEELAIPYQSPLDGKVHRYYPDFYLKVKQYDHTVKEFIVEIKPQNQVKPPKKNPKRKTKAWLYAIKEYGRNQAKWESATHYCNKHGLEFKVLTEHDLGLNNPYK
jgi:hypothetical protein